MGQMCGCSLLCSLSWWQRLLCAVGLRLCCKGLCMRPQGDVALQHSCPSIHGGKGRGDATLVCRAHATLWTWLSHSGCNRVSWCQVSNTRHGKGCLPMAPGYHAVLLGWIGGNFSLACKFLLGWTMGLWMHRLRCVFPTQVSSEPSVGQSQVPLYPVCPWCNASTWTGPVQGRGFPCSLYVQGFTWA